MNQKQKLINKKEPARERHSNISSSLCKWSTLNTSNAVTLRREKKSFESIRLINSKKKWHQVETKTFIRPKVTDQALKMHQRPQTSKLFPDECFSLTRLSVRKLTGEFVDVSREKMQQQQKRNGTFSTLTRFVFCVYIRQGNPPIFIYNKCPFWNLIMCIATKQNQIIVETVTQQLSTKKSQIY